MCLMYAPNAKVCLITRVYSSYTLLANWHHTKEYVHAQVMWIASCYISLFGILVTALIPVFGSNVNFKFEYAIIPHPIKYSLIISTDFPNITASAESTTAGQV